MGAALYRRSLAATAVTALAVAAAPTLESAFAADVAAPAPDFSGSAFVVADSDTAFSDVLARPGQVVGRPGQIAVEFTSPIKVSRNDFTADPTQGGTPQLDSTQAAPESYFVSDTDSSKLTGTVAVDAADDQRLLFTPPAGVTDGGYTLHVGVFAKDACPDIPFGTPAGSAPACTTYDGFVTVPDGSQPFDFTVDSVAPEVAVDPAVPAVTADNIKAVPLSGTTSPDTQSLSLTIKSTGGSAPRFVPVQVGGSTGSDGLIHWTAAPDLSALADGTLTVTAKASDFARNQSDPQAAAATATTSMAAHPSAPRDLAVRSGDRTARLTWRAPSSTGGHPITSYVATATDTTDPGVAPTTGHVSCSSTCPTAYTLGGLVNGHRYAIALAAVSDAGRGLAATGSAQPRAATTLTAAFNKPTATAGHHVVLSGRLTRTANGSGVKDVVLTITPHYANGTTGKAIHVTTDVFGIWHKGMTARRTAVYTVRYRGDAATRAATARARLRVRAG